jgi:hypothetical protein
MAKYSKKKEKKKKPKTIKVFVVLFLFSAISMGLFFLGSPPSITTFIPHEIVPNIVTEGSNPITIMSGATVVETTALFDIALNIPKEFVKGNPENVFIISVALTNFGSEGPKDVSLAYIIIDSKGDVVFIEHENRIVETHSSFLKTLDLPDLKQGEYQLYSELLYYNATAIASGKFKII